MSRFSLCISKHFQLITIFSSIRIESKKDASLVTLSRLQLTIHENERERARQGAAKKKKKGFSSLPTAVK
jgi:hypothetical protein